MARETLVSWGRVARAHDEAIALASRFDPLPLPADAARPVLPFGNGRSYGDSCLNPGGTALKTRALDRFIAFDAATGVLACEAGVLLSGILDLVVPQGWFLPSVPGTRFVTVGGAIANDVHGKNHHVAGTFGCHVRRFELLRSSGERLACSPTENAGLYAATIGGLGLTGLVTWAEIQLRRVAGPWMDAETIRFDSLAEFFELAAQSDRDYEYTVSWIDCAGQGKRLGRGLFTRGNHAPGGEGAPAHASRSWTFPFVPPVSMVNRLTLKAFNAAYYRKQAARRHRAAPHYEPFFFPLDGILEWNRMYGPAGFHQYQCVVPTTAGPEAMDALLREIAQSGFGSFLAVLKVFGDIASPGLLSFPMPGVTLALDFPERGARLHELFARMDAIVVAAGGRLYPAKDSRMPARVFQAGYPGWKAFGAFVDPRFSSAFWRRVTEAA